MNNTIKINNIENVFESLVSLYNDLYTQIKHEITVNNADSNIYEEIKQVSTNFSKFLVLTYENLNIDLICKTNKLFRNMEEKTN